MTTATRVRNDPNYELLSECLARCVYRDHFSILGRWIAIGCDGWRLADRIRPFLSTFWQAQPPAGAGSCSFYVCGDEDRGYQVISAAGRSVESRSWRAVFSYLLSMVHAHVWAASPEVLPLHSAAVSRHSRGILFPASSGRGKTTLALELATHGCAYLSDEFAPICLSTTHVLPYARPLQVSAEAASRLLGERWAEMLPGPPFLDDDGAERYVLDPSGTLPIGQPAPVRHIVFLEEGFSERGRLQALSKAEALGRLFSSALVYHSDSAWKQRTVSALTAVVGGADCVSMDLGPIGTNSALLSESLLQGIGGMLPDAAAELDDLHRLCSRVQQMLGGEQA